MGGIKFRDKRRRFEKEISEKSKSWSGYLAHLRSHFPFSLLVGLDGACLHGPTVPATLMGPMAFCCWQISSFLWMVRGSWVGDPLSIFFFFLFSSVFRSTLLPLWEHQLLGMGLGVHPLCLDPFPFLRSSHLSFLLHSFLGVDARRPAVAGRSSLCNK